MDWIYSARPFLHICSSRENFSQKLLFHSDHAFIVHAITKVNIWQFHMLTASTNEINWMRVFATLIPTFMMEHNKKLRSIGLYLAAKIAFYILISDTYFNRPTVASVRKSLAPYSLRGY